MSPTKWIEATDSTGIISKAGNNGCNFAHKDIAQLVVLSNLESINSVLIHQGMVQSESLKQLNEIAIKQMKSLLGNKSINKLK